MVGLSLVRSGSIGVIFRRLDYIFGFVDVFVGASETCLHSCGLVLALVTSPLLPNHSLFLFSLLLLGTHAFEDGLGV